jgi:uncharacterized protein YecT (DUF1311 family)
VPGTDCNKAVKPVEQMLCYDGDLARADGELLGIYNRKRASVADKEALRRNELEWISRRDSECNVPPSGNWTETQLRQAKNCLLQKIRDRMDELSR